MYENISFYSWGIMTRSLATTSLRDWLVQVGACLSRHDPQGRGYRSPASLCPGSILSGGRQLVPTQDNVGTANRPVHRPHLMDFPPAEPSTPALQIGTVPQTYSGILSSEPPSLCNIRPSQPCIRTSLTITSSRKPSLTSPLLRPPDPYWLPRKLP